MHTMTTITLFHGTNSKYNTAGIHAGASWTSDIRIAMEYAKSQRSELGGVVRVLATVVEWDDIADIELGDLSDDNIRTDAVRESGLPWGCAAGDVDPNGREHVVYVTGCILDASVVWVDHAMMVPAGSACRACWHELDNRMTDDAIADVDTLDALVAGNEYGELYADDLPVTVTER
jgi:hypothetical protein